MADACIQYKETCSALYSSLAKLKTAKSNTESDSKDVLEAEIIETMCAFSLLKKYNCKAQSQCKRVRDNTKQLKRKLDSTDLTLKNLEFEEIYLQREIKKCLHYKSVDEELDLIPSSEFEKSVRDGEKELPSSKYQYMIDRLQWELEQRKLMKEKQEGWDVSKTTLEKEIAELKAYLESLPPQLEDLLTSTAQVQDCLGLKIVHRRSQSEMATWLPPQLYNIYSQVIGYSEHSKCGATVTIVGDIEKAKNLTNENSDTEDVPPETEIRQSKRRSAVHDPGKKKVFKAYPLTIEVVVPCDDGVHAKVQFTYLVKVKVVTVTISLMITTGSPWRDKFSVGSDYMSSKELLCSLWSGDYGEECPNPGHLASLLNKYNLPSKSKIPSSLGRPFLWAQRLSGVKCWENGALDVNISRQTVAPFLAAIKHRCLARLALKYQLRNLNSTKTVEEGAIAQPTILTELSSWKEVQYDALSGYPWLTRPLKQNLYSDKDTLYEIVVKRGKTSCKGIIGLSLEYPVVPPVVVLQITSPEGSSCALSNRNIQTIEEELNVHIDNLYEDKVEYVLTKVVNKLCLCMDVYVEGQGLEPQIKFFMNKYKGPHNILPFMFNSDKQFFEHRQ